MGLRFTKGGLLPLIKSCLMRRLVSGPDGLIDSMCTNAAFALGNLAACQNPQALRDINHAQILQAGVISLLQSKEIAKPLRYALLNAASGCLNATETSDLEDGNLLSCLVSELTQTHEQTLLKAL